MTDYKEKIKKICNYSEDTKNPYNTSISLSYIDMISKDEDAHHRELKRMNRDLVIDIILDEKNEIEWENRNLLPNTEFDSVCKKIFSVNTRAQKIKSFEDLEYEVFNKLENLTKNSPTSKTLLNNTLNITLNNDPEHFRQYGIDIERRRVLTKIRMCSNIITMESLNGQANTVIVGTDALKYVENYDLISTPILLGMNMIVTPYIDKDKIIVMKTENKTGIGLNVIFRPNESVYYMVETPQSWEKTMKWFWIK